MESNYHLYITITAPFSSSRRSKQRGTMEEFWKDINHVPSSSSSSASPPPPPPPSSYKFHEFFSQPFRINLDSPSTTSDTNPSFVRTSSTSLFPPSSSSSHKRLFEPEGSLRSKRMIKNRESAARSRARKQARYNLCFFSLITQL